MERKKTFPAFFKYMTLVLVCFATTYSMAATKAHYNAFSPSCTLQSDDGRILKGHVTDEMGQPMIGVVVNTENNMLKTLTDIDGNFEIKIYDNTVLILTFIGYKTEKISVSNRQEINVSMQPVSATIDNVVVIGYGTAKKESLTSAISTLDSKDIARSSAVNTSGAIAGKIAGVNSRQSQGRPGDVTDIVIRNMGAPLYVVDGMQVDAGQFNNIDFNDIESISVLKDASAAIYGVRAGNGVIVVTTKSGRRKTSSTINVNGYTGIQSMFRYPDGADAATWVRAKAQSATILKQTNPYTPEDLQKYYDGTEKGYRNFNWKKFIFDTAPQNYIEINSTGGSERMSYYAAMSHVKQESIVRNYGHFERTNLQLNVNADIAKNLTFGMKINGRVENTHHVAFNSYLSGNDAYWTAFYASLNNEPIMRPYANDNPKYPAVCRGIYTNFANLTYERAGTDKDSWRIFQGSLNLEWEPLKDLKLKGIINYMVGARRHNMRAKGYSLYGYDEATDTYYEAIRSNSGLIQRDYMNEELINGQLSANYNTTIAVKHKISAFIGAENYLNSYPNLTIQSKPETDAVKLLDKNDVTLMNDVGDEKSARVGFMGRFNYSYADRYILEFSARYDGSWKFPPNHRWGFFPSISGGWRISEEPLWQKLDLQKYIQYMKIRLSWGILGDDNISGYNANSWRGGYNYGTTGAVMDGAYITGASVRSLPITNISWIKAHMLDVGIDFGLLDNRLTGTFDFFRRERKGLPAGRYDVRLPGEVGFSLPSENLNSDLVKGFDASVKWTERKQDFSYSVSGNITLARRYNWNQYKPTFGNSRDYYVYNARHRLAGAAWGLVCIGQFRTWEEIAEYPVNIDGKGNSTLRPGDLIYKDTNKDGIITDDDQQAVSVLGYEDRNTPIINFGMSLSLEWKGMDFAADFAGAAKVTHIFNWEQRFPFHSGNSPMNMLADQWRLSDPFDAGSEIIPGHYPTNIVGNAGHSNYRFSTFWMKDVNYIKLRNLEIGYTLPLQWTAKLGIKRMRIYTLMQNLFSIDNLGYYNIDPETASTAGFDYPTMRIINFGFNLTF